VYRVPSRRKKQHSVERLNLIPILDAVFIFIFFLMMSANFIKIFEIPSDVPIVSDIEPPKNQKPLALTVTISAKRLNVYTGVPRVLRRSFEKTKEGKYDVQGLHEYLIRMKKKHLKEKSAILEPLINVSYEELVEVMDSIRVLRTTDPTMYVKDKDGIDVRLNTLFGNIIFGNIQS
jgi:biopolymer transport protein ExbD